MGEVVAKFAGCNGHLLTSPKARAPVARVHVLDAQWAQVPRPHISHRATEHALPVFHLILTVLKQSLRDPQPSPAQASPGAWGGRASGPAYVLEVFLTRQL